MFRLIVVSYLVIASAVGPSLCCCATTSTISCVRSWFGLGPIACAGGTACSHSQSESGVSQSHKHATHHGSCHEHSKPAPNEVANDVDSQALNSSAAEKPDNRAGKEAPRKPCPCKEDGNERPALAPSVVAGKSVQPTGGIERLAIDWSLGVCVDQQTTGENRAVHGFRTHQLSGREILRALHILRC
jgi:hypothetical protein